VIDVHVYLTEMDCQSPVCWQHSTVDVHL